jgi:3-hydroxyisobutyrate dehydrogenase
VSSELTDSTALFVGLGAMGRPMVGQLCAAGLTLKVADADNELARRVTAEIDATVVASIDSSNAAADVDYVVLMLPDSSVVEDVLLGRDGLLARMRPGSRIVDMSSCRPVSTVMLAAKAADAGVVFVDAPVSGGVRRATTGELSIMVGAADADFADVLPLLRQMGKDVIHVGPPGAGHAMKALNNLLSAIGLVAASEVLAVGAAFGLDPQVMLQVLNGSTGRNHATEVKMERFVLSRAFDSGFSLQLMVKDLTTALDLAHQTGTPLPLGAGALEECAAALRLLGIDADHTEIAAYVESRSGTELR